MLVLCSMAPAAALACALAAPCPPASWCMLRISNTPSCTPHPCTQADGELYVVGSNDSSQLGIRQQECVAEPTRVQGLESRQVEQVRPIC